ncbi:MAG TPA: hypothetical protein VG816_08835 [Solirubrobacterales bacterium]|nr:hypothetical protein [Solirubrobacterales bacterium]
MSLALAVCGEGADPSPEIERRFFGKVRLPNGTWKTTYPNRLDDLNARLLEFLPRDRGLELMDVAVSSGISTLEWSDQLQANNIRHALVAGDLAPRGRLTSWGHRLAILFDDEGREPLLLELGSLSVPIDPGGRLVGRSMPVLVPLLRGLAARARPLGPGAAAPHRGLVTRPVSLVSPALEQRAEIELVGDDVTVPGRFVNRFDAIRAANLVQPAYFDRRGLLAILANLRDRLRERGLLAICRTTAEGVNRATIFRRQGDHFASEASLNGGSEVAELVLSL